MICETIHINIPMIVQNLNFYSLLVPILMFIMGSSVLFYQYYQPLPKYLHYYAISQIGVGISVLLATLLQGQTLLESCSYIYGIFMLACIFNVYAIHQCLRVKTQIAPLVIIVPSALCALFYYSIFDDQSNNRMLIVGFATSLIYSHQCFTVFKKRNRHTLDRILKGFLLCLIILPALRGSMLYVFYDSPGPISMQPPFWATTQLMLILIGAAFLTLFISYTIQTSFVHLRQERNLDPLTGLKNRRAFNEQLEMIRRQPVTQNALVICDLDHFKRINDQYGHYVGDLALKHVSRIMMTSLRKQDEISRFGGEEFIIILHDTQTPIALQIAERIRSSIAHNPLIYEGQTIPLTISIGVSFFHFYSEFEEALQSADHLLYQAKDYGRNQIQYEVLT